MITNISQSEYDALTATIKTLILDASTGSPWAKRTSRDLLPLLIRFRGFIDTTAVTDLTLSSSVGTLVDSIGSGTGTAGLLPDILASGAAFGGD